MSPDPETQVGTSVLTAGVTDDHERTTVDVRRRPPRTRRRRWFLLLAALVALATAAYSTTRGDADPRDGTSAVTREGMSAEHGVDINLVAVTAAGGLIQLRMQVTDPDKADLVMHGDDETRPIIVDEESGGVIRMPSAPHHRDELDLGGQYFFLMANTGNAIHAGSLVSVVIEDTRLEHVRVEG